MKVGKAGKAGPHAAYIAREDQYQRRLETGERLEAKEAGNMPAWAKDSPQEFWKAADAFERANGTTYREMEIALPRELSPPERAELVREWVGQEIGSKHAYQWAIHNPTAADDQEQPHVHLMFSERQIDGIDRDPDQYFKRYNAKNPEKGGARKGYGDNAGKTLTAKERAEDLKVIRSRWEAMCNKHLERAGHGQRIDMRSYAERGIAVAPEIKQLPSQWRGQNKEKIIELRAARQGKEQADRALFSLMPDLKGELSKLHEPPKKEATPKPQQAGPALLAPQQMQVIEAELKKYESDRRTKVERVTHKAQERNMRRWRSKQSLEASKPEPPSGLLAMFKKSAYEQDVGRWRGAMNLAQKLCTQAHALKESLQPLVRSTFEWSEKKLFSQPGVAQYAKPYQDTIKQQQADAMAEARRKQELRMEQRAQRKTQGKNRGFGL